MNLAIFPKFSGGRGLSEAAAGLVRRGAWGAADQALISATNFATLVLVARSVSPVTFGTFSLALTFILFVLAFQGALLNQPFTVISATRADSGYRRYVTSVLAGQGLFVSLTAVPVLVAAAISNATGIGPSGLIAVVVPAQVAWQLQEFVRQVLYVEGRMRPAFFNDLISYGGQTSAVIVLALAGALTPVTALAALALTSGLAAVVGLLQIRGSIDWSFSISRATADNQENWKFGRWMLGSTALSWMSDLLQPAVLAGIAGVAAAGALRVVVTVMGPTHVLLKGMDMSFVPIAARVANSEEPSAMTALVKRMYALTAPLMLGYCALVAAFAGPLLRLVYGPDYGRYGWLLVLASLSYALAYLYMPVSIALRGKRISDAMFRAYIWNAAFFWTGGLAAMYFLGLTGAGLSLVASSGIVGIALWRRYLSETGTGRTPLVLADAVSGG